MRLCTRISWTVDRIVGWMDWKAIFATCSPCTFLHHTTCLFCLPAFSTAPACHYYAHTHTPAPLHTHTHFLPATTHHTFCTYPAFPPPHCLPFTCHTFCPPGPSPAHTLPVTLLTHLYLSPPPSALACTHIALLPTMSTSCLPRACTHTTTTTCAFYLTPTCSHSSPHTSAFACPHLATHTPPAHHAYGPCITTHTLPLHTPALLPARLLLLSPIITYSPFYHLLLPASDSDQANDSDDYC